MPTGRVGRLLWAFGLSVATGFVVTSVVRQPAALSAMQFTFGAVLVSALALGPLLWWRWAHWQRLGPTVGFAVYFLSLFVGVVVLGGIPGLLLGDRGSVTIAVQLAGSSLAVAGSVWLCFYGGAWVLLGWVAPHLGVEIRSRNA